MHQNLLNILKVDEVHKDQLGKIVSSSNENQDRLDKMNFYTVENTLAPIHVALIRIIAWLVDNTEAKFLIYDATRIVIHHKNLFRK
jgi:high-affinity Fe2+/Pb2+ permease